MPGGRPPRLLKEPDLQGRVARLVWAGLRPPLAAAAVGVPASTHHLWRHRGRLAEAAVADGRLPLSIESSYRDYTQALDRAAIQAHLRAAPQLPARPTPLDLLQQRRADRTNDRTTERTAS